METPSTVERSEDGVAVERVETKVSHTLRMASNCVSASFFDEIPHSSMVLRADNSKE
jgi:hypothetical protein